MFEENFKVQRKFLRIKYEMESTLASPPALKDLQGHKQQTKFPFITLKRKVTCGMIWFSIIHWLSQKQNLINLKQNCLKIENCFDLAGNFQKIFGLIFSHFIHSRSQCFLY